MQSSSSGVADPSQPLPRQAQPPTRCGGPDTSSTVVNMKNRNGNVNLKAQYTLRLPILSWATAILLILATRIQLTSAVQVPFDNCLSSSYIYTNVPEDKVQLQFVPLVVDAQFHSNNLQVTVWGNVTGRVGDTELPAPGSAAWNNTTNGKIENSPDTGSTEKKATTLHSKVDVLTYTPYANDSFFCQDLLNSTGCPLGPVFNDDIVKNLDQIPADPSGLPAFQLKHGFGSGNEFTSFVPTLIIVYGDLEATPIGCISAVVTPSLGGIAWLLKFLPLIVLIVVGFATAFAAIFSPWGTSDIFHWTSNYGRDPDLLRLVTPGFGDCLQYIQFVVLTGGLSLNYPGYYQPVASQGSWSALMFNESFVAKAESWQSIQDGIYVTRGVYGMEHITQLDGMKEVEDAWPGMMIWLLVIIAAALIIIQLGFIVRWFLRFINQSAEEDLRSKNIPFSFGMIIRLVFSYFLLPIVALSAFQLVVAGRSNGVLVAMAVVTLALIIGFSIRLMYLVASTKPRSHLFDDLPTVLLYGPLYNTYSDEAATFAIIPIILTILRGIAIGAVQPSGIAQIVILAICEVVQMLTLYAFRPFHPDTSMNFYHSVLSALRFISVILMVAFAPSMGLTEGPKGWVGYAILFIHGCVLLIGFFLNALQTIVEVIARLCGAGGDDIRGQRRGGLSKIFGARQLSRRVDRRGGPSRQSQLSTTGMLDADRASKRGYGRVRSGSAGSMGILMAPGHRSSSALGSIDVYAAPMGGGSAFTPTTPREASTFSFLPSPGQATRPQPTADPYYRPPRARRGTLEGGDSPSPHRARDSIASIELANRRTSQNVPDGEDFPVAGRASSAPAPVPALYTPVFAPPRADYATREVDFYYGVRGPALNSEGLGRKLGTGPADPTSPMATATGWIKSLFGGKTKEKGKGFEVVRSSRMPPAMKARGGEFSDEPPPEGIPVALGVLRNGPIDSDDEDETPKPKRTSRTSRDSASGGLLNESGEPRSEDELDIETTKVQKDPPLLPDLDAGESFRIPSRIHSKASRQASQRSARLAAGDGAVPDIPDVPRKSSKRNSSGDRLAEFSSSRDVSQTRTNLNPEDAYLHQEGSTRLPFDRTNSQKRLSVSSTAPTEDLNQASARISDGGDERPASIGYVHQRNIEQIDPEQRADLLGSTAEVINDPRKRSPGSSVSGRS